MKTKWFIAVVASGLFLTGAATYQQAHRATPVYWAAEGAGIVVNNDGSLVVRNGGYIDVESTGVLKIAGVDVTSAVGAVGSTALSAAELAYLDGVTAGTRSASKAIVVDASGTIDVLDIDSVVIGGTTVTATADELNILDTCTATAAEINLLDTAVAGTAVASKALVLGASKDVDDLTVDDLSMGGGYIYEDGAIPIYGATSIDATTNSISATLADGTTLGDIKVIYCEVGTNPTTVTIAHHDTEDAEELLFDAADEYATLQWMATEWVTLSMTATAP